LADYNLKGIYSQFFVESPTPTYVSEKMKILGKIDGLVFFLILFDSNNFGISPLLTNAEK